MQAIRKCVWTLRIGNYEPAICALTFPTFRAYARKIGAEFRVIEERRFPDWPIVYEKLQLHELGREFDWNIYVDADAMISPEFFDLTAHLDKGTVAHNGKDFAGLRWRADDPYFLRDGRWLGSCNWFTVASDWCLDLWRPLDDLTLPQACERIALTIDEQIKGHMEPSHLIDDYTLSRNIARFGLKFTTVLDVVTRLREISTNGQKFNPYLWHQYNMGPVEKVQKMLAVLSTRQGYPAFHRSGQVQNSQVGPVMVPDGGGEAIQPCGVGWQVVTPDDATAFRQRWNIPL